LTIVDYAHAIRHLVDVQYSDAETIVLVEANLNTHKPASLSALQLGTVPTSQTFQEHEAWGCHSSTTEPRL
jgi:hypothetical protein